MAGAGVSRSSATGADLLVGIDIGTTNLKLLAVTPWGEVRHLVSRPTAVRLPRDGWAEFDLASIWDDIIDGLRELREACGRAVRIVSIAVDSIGESFVGLDADDKMVTPCPTWFDRRTRNARADLGIDVRTWYETTGMADDDIATLHRLHWLFERDPDLRRKVRRWLNVGDAIVWRLSGRAVASPSLAARSGLYDRRTQSWSAPLLESLGLAPDTLPDPVATASVAAGLTSEVAAATGMPKGTPIVHAGHDHPCAGVGCHVIAPGTLLDSTGTAEAVKIVVPGPLSYDETLGGRYDCYPHAVPERFVLSGHLPSAGAFLAWAAGLWSGSSDAKHRCTLADAANSVAGARGVRALPFLEGTGSPFHLRDQAAELLGLRAFHTRSDVLRAAYEGCAAWLALNVDVLTRIVGTSPTTIVAVGGGTRSGLWLAIKAAFLGRQLSLPAVDEAAALGAALVGGMAVGAVPHDLDGVVEPPTPTVAADPDEAAAYDLVAAAYRTLYRGRFGAI